jgi:hypothetical protein
MGDTILNNPTENLENIEEESNENSEDYPPHMFDSLKEYQFLGYGVGHVMNDLIGGCLF